MPKRALRESPDRSDHARLESLETLEAGEAEMIAEMTDILRRKMARDYTAKGTLRDAHPKTVGLLRGSFRIVPDLPAALRVGVFAKAQDFDCWIRCSNASGKVQSDAIRDARGLAIKLPAAGQDFVLMNSPVMPLGTIALFRDAVFYAIESSPVLLAAKLLVTGHIGTMLGLLGLRTLPTSPLDIRYWSTTPYRWGPGAAVKYALVPTAKTRSTLPTKPGEHYLAEAMQEHLARQVATFDFCVQLQGEGMPIEDAAVRWDEVKSPLIKVATLHIPKQKFRTAQRAELAEALSFSPAHALAAHAPLGGLNRARTAIYAALSAFRHERSGRADQR